MKIEELFETAVYTDKRIKYKSLDVSDLDDAIALMKEHCSDAMWMLEEDRPIYRGSRSAKLTHNISVADPSKTERESSNTSNYYTLIFDNHPEMKDFPKRSKSFIASTDYDRARGYGGDIDHLNVLIPFNNVKIGVVGSDDIWDSHVLLFGEYIALVTLNEIFAHMRITETWTDILHFFDSMTKDKNLFMRFIEKLEVHCSMRINASDRSVKNAQADMKKYMLDAYSPRNVGLRCMTSKNMDRDMDTEVWVGGKCLVIKYLYWRKMRLQYISSMS